MSCQRQHVEGICAAFPAVQQDREVTRWRLPDRSLARVVPEQAYAVAAIDESASRAREHVLRAQSQQRPAQLQARKDRLQMRVREPAWRCEGEIREGSMRA